MTTRPRPDPYLTFNFLLELEGRPIAGFSEVSGLDAVVGPIDHRDGGDARPGVRKLPGQHKLGNVALKRGVANRKALFEWQANGSANRRGATVVLFDAAHRPVARWRVAQAWISKIEGPALQAAGNDVALESLELTHEGLSTEE